MIRLQSSGWQATMIDLCLILFLLTSAALSEAGPSLAGDARGADLAGADNASATYRAAAGAPSLGDWLAEQSPDPRQRLTIHAAYRPGDEGLAATRAIALLRDAGPAAATAKVVLVRAQETRIIAELGYDMPQEELARSLLSFRPETLTGDK